MLGLLEMTIALLPQRGCGERASGENIRTVGLTPEQIGARIVQAREAMKPKPWSQFDLAIALGVAPSTIYRWEKGRAPSVAHLRQLEEVLNLEPGHLIETPERQVELADLRNRLDALDHRLESLEDGLDQSREAVVEILASIHDQLVQIQRSQAPPGAQAN